VIVSEVFGPTIQGEGPSTGRRAGFVRLGRCDLHCAWCDTPYTWDWKGRNGVTYDPAVELQMMDVEEVTQRVRDMDVPLVVITGGEPLLQMKQVTRLAENLEPTHQIEVETNGRHRPIFDLIQAVTAFNVSPKLDNSGQDEDRTIIPSVLSTFAASGKARFKWVCDSPADVDRVARLSVGLGIPASATWIMAEGRVPGEVHYHLSQVVEATIAHHFNLTGRLHLEIWGDKRGH
jgi:7-carboxy-7-deazaguanine synthase